MFHKITIYLIAMMVLSGCASNKVSQKGLDSVERGEKAVVIMPCNTAIKAHDWHGLSKSINNFRCTTTWQRGATDQKLIQQLHQDVYVVDPGIYNLRSFYAIGAGYEYSVHDLSYIAQFYVRGGEVVYLGDMLFDLTKSVLIAKMISIEDQYPRIRVMMAKENPVLLNKLDKRLMKLSEVVEIVKNTNGIVNPIFPWQK